MNSNKSTKNNFKWSFFIQIVNQVFGFVISIILARILSPSDFGVLGLTAIFINLAKKITDGGLGVSLIRTSYIDDRDLTVVFYFNLICSFLLYVALFFVSPFIAYFFEYSLLEPLLKVYGLVIVMSAFTITQSVWLNKALDFKTQFKILLPSLLLSGIVGITAAYHGYGVWSLIIKEMAFVFLSSIQLWYYNKWKPLLFFDKIIFKRHFNFGYKLVLTDLTSQLFKDSYHAIISKSFSPAQLGFFTRARSMEELPNSIIFNTVNRVLFPMLSKFHNNDLRLKEVYRQIIKLVTFLVTPFLMLLYLIAEPLFVFLLTDKWLPAVPYFKILIVAGMVSPLQPYLLNICKVKGRSDLVLKLSFVEYFFISLSMLAIVPFGLTGLLWGLVVATICKLIVAMIYAGRLVNYSFFDQLFDLKWGYLYSIIGFFVIYIVGFSNLIPFMSLLSDIVIKSIIFYSVVFFCAYIFKFPNYIYLKELIRGEEVEK